MWLIRSFHLLTVIASGINAITVNPPNPLKDGTFTLTATATGATLTWVKDSMTLTACFVAANTCAFPTPSSMPNAVITIDSVTSVSTITISNATQALNGGVYEATNALSRTVIVSTLPSSVQWESQPVNGSSLTTGTWIAKTPCVFSETSINIEFTIFVDGVQHSMQRVSTYYESDACEAPEKMVLAKLVLDSDSYFNKRVYIVANASHNLFPSEPYVESVPSNEVIFEGRDTTTVEMSTTATDEQSTTTVNPYPLSYTFQTTETTEKTQAVSSTSLYESSEVSVSTPMIFLNGENIGESHLYLIVVIVLSSVCGFITILAIAIIIFYNCDRFRICNTCNKCVETEESANRTAITNGVQHTKGTATNRKEDLNIKRAKTTGDGKRKYDRHKNEQKGRKMVKDRRTNAETKYDFGQIGLNVYDFESIRTEDTQRNTRVTNMQGGRVFPKNEPNPINSQMNINNSLFYRQTNNSGRRMLDLQDYDHNYFRRHLQDTFYHNDNRRVHTKYPSDQHGLYSSYFYPNDQHKANVLHPMSNYDKYWSDSHAYNQQQPYSTCSNDWY